MVGSPLPYESWQMEQPEQLGVISMEKRIHENTSQHAKTSRKAGVPSLTMGDYVNLCFLVLFSAHQALSCAQMEVYGPATRQPDNPTACWNQLSARLWRAASGWKCTGSKLPCLWTIGTIELCFCCFDGSMSMDPVMLFDIFDVFFVSCLFWSCDMPVVTCWVKAARLEKT